MQKCRHFRGVQHKTCEAGVELASLRDTSGPGMARWPCIQGSGERAAVTSCEKRSLLTADEQRELYARLDAAMADAMADKCPQCGAALTVRGGGGAVVKTCPAHGFVMRGCKVLDD
jgi:hypothetical protein